MRHQHGWSGPGSHRAYMHAQWRRGWRRPKYNVPMNIDETDTQYEVHLYATGFDKENIKVNVSDDILIVSGTRIIDEGKEPNFVVQEFPVKNFERRISLRGQVDSKSISARQENGVLIITLPKTPEAQKSVQEIEVV